jgi:hypothetical protein
VSHLLTTFFWTTSSFSGTGQLDEGPFHVGTVNKFFRAEVRGNINYEGVSVADTGVFANYAAWGLQQIAHGSSPLDVVSSADDDAWLMRRQTGSQDVVPAYAPNSDTGAFFVTNTVADDWAGQLAIGADTDVYLVIKGITGSGLANLNTYGTIRLWWI